MKRSAFFVSLVSLFYSFIFPLQTFAADCADNEQATDLGCIPTDAPGFVSKFYGYGLGLIGGVSLLFIIIGGFFILTSQGDPTKLAVGKSYISYAIIGLLLAIFGYVFISVLVVDIIRVPGFN